jgi:hypothetical protein
LIFKIKLHFEKLAHEQFAPFRRLLFQQAIHLELIYSAETPFELHLIALHLDLMLIQKFKLHFLNLRGILFPIVRSILHFL